MAHYIEYKESSTNFREVVQSENVKIEIVKNSCVTLFEDFSFALGPINVEYQLQENSVLNLIQLWGHNSSQCKLQTTLQAGSSLNLYQWIIPKDAILDIGFDCFSDFKNVSMNSESTIFSDNDSKIGHKIKFEYRDSNSTGSQKVKSIAANNVIINVDSIVKVNKNIAQIETTQSLKGMTLSKKSKILAKPILEIDSFDVKCSHGATVGPIDQEAIKYLEMRGIDQDVAKQMLINSFLAEQMMTLKNERIKERISRTFKNNFGITV
jgi:Fe-S cluster assembly scaffold protein SufB